MTTTTNNNDNTITTTNTTDTTTNAQTMVMRRPRWMRAPKQQEKRLEARLILEAAGLLLPLRRRV